MSGASSLRVFSELSGNTINVVKKSTNRRSESTKKNIT